MADGGTGRGGTTGRGDPEEGRGRADAVGGGEEKRTGKGREPCCRGVPYELRGPPPSTHGFLRQCLPRRGPNAVWAGSYDPFGGCFWAEFRELPPRFPAEFPPSAVCRRLRGKGPEAGPVLCSSMRESGPLCDCAVCFFQLCSESSQSRAFSAPHFAKATSWLGSCTCMGTGEGADEEEGACGARSKRPRLNPQLARASFCLFKKRREALLYRGIFSSLEDEALTRPLFPPLR